MGPPTIDPHEWLAVDPDPDTRRELAELLEGPDDAVAERFGDRLRFGTAGLRGPLGAGPTRMNRVIVRMAAAALGRTLIARGEAGRGVAIGFDARHRSDVFARDTAQVLAQLGLDAHLLDRRAPTPLLAFAVLHLQCDAGVMVTASHNPPADNGYKVYWGDGAQIVPPIDALIEREMAGGGLVDDDALAPPDDPAIRPVDVDALTRAYLEATLGPSARQPDPNAGRLTVVATALHGVGDDVLRRAFAHAGLPEPVPVASQQAPDPDFPTVSFPNPEEPGAMDEAMAAGRAAGADLVLANDPDADRLAVAVPDPDADQGYRMLTGDEVGVLLGAQRLAETSGPDRMVASSLVSSSMLGRLAEAAGVAHHETLTGFKWIMRAEADHPGERLVFGYEEALGYAVSPAVRDKDGITAAVAIVRLAGRLAADGALLTERLDELVRRHGVHATGQVGVRFDDDPGAAGEVMAALRAARPAELAGSAVVSCDDLLDHDPPSDILRWRTAAADRVIVRPSGTEAKLKCYLEVVVDDRSLDDARAAARRRIDELSVDLRGRLDELAR